MGVAAGTSADEWKSIVAALGEEEAEMLREQYFMMDDLDDDFDDFEVRSSAAAHYCISRPTLTACVLRDAGAQTKEETKGTRFYKWKEGRCSKEGQS
jgi:hypothetical protein